MVMVTNNIVSAVHYAGYVAPGHDCDVYAQDHFKNNIAHSVKGAGAIIFPNPLSSSQKTCMEGSFFIAYKVTEEAVVSYFSTLNAKFSHMIMIDNGQGPTLMIG